jgi:hypothetical protein
MQKVSYGHQTLIRFYADFAIVEKNAKNLLTKKLYAKKCTKLEFVLFYSTGTNMHKFLANNFVLVHFLNANSKEMA